MIRIGIVGCGAASQQLHLPALQRAGGFSISAIVDTQEAVARSVAHRLGVGYAGADYRDVRDVDAVIISTPHALHSEMVKHFLEAGVHVLCEKPLSLSQADALALTSLAEMKELVLAVGVFRRYYPVTAFMKQVLDSEWLGALKSVDVEEGGGYDWDLQSKAMMVKSLAGGGVLVDTGAHTIDRTLWVLGGDAELVSYEDNSTVGIETDCVLNANIKRAKGVVPLRIALSRTRVLRNDFTFSFEHGELVVPANDPSEAWVSDRRLDAGTLDGRFRVETHAKDHDSSLGPSPYFEEQLKDFARSIEGKQKPLNDATTTLPCIRLTEQCYSIRTSMAEPWSTTEFLEKIKESNNE